MTVKPNLRLEGKRGLSFFIMDSHGLGTRFGQAFLKLRIRRCLDLGLGLGLGFVNRDSYGLSTWGIEKQ